VQSSNAAEKARGQPNSAVWNNFGKLLEQAQTQGGVMSGVNSRISNLERAVRRLELSVHSPREHDHESIGQHDDGPQESENTPRATAVISEAPKNADNAKTRSDAAVPWRKRRPPRFKRLRWRNMLTNIGIVAGVGYAVVTCLQWGDLRHNFYVDQRAWLRPTYLIPEQPSAAIKVQIDNIGKSPAFNAKATVVYEVVNWQVQPSFDLSSPGTVETIPAVLFPTEFDSFQALLSPNGILTAEDTKRVNSGDSYVALFGQMIYRDPFGNHWMRFCTWHAYGPTSYRHQYNSTACALYTATGEGDPQSRVKPEIKMAASAESGSGANR
jgi:hypothetical protein